jgi:hypothetical protein
MKKEKRVRANGSAAAVNNQTQKEAPVWLADWAKARADLPRDAESWERMAGWDRNAAMRATGLRRKHLLYRAAYNQEMAASFRRLSTAKNFAKAVLAFSRKFQAERVMLDLWYDHHWLEEFRLRGLPVETVSEWLRFKDQTLREWLRSLRARAGASVGQNRAART